jgi:hypothetical protein
MTEVRLKTTDYRMKDGGSDAEQVEHHPAGRRVHSDYREIRASRQVENHVILTSAVCNPKSAIKKD